MLEMGHGFRVFDVNARLAPDPDAPERGRAVSPERLERELRQAGVVRAAVAPEATPDGEGYLRANNAVARLSVDRPFLTVARLGGPRDPTDTAAARLRNLAVSRAAHHPGPEEVEQFAYDDRFHGFLLVPRRDGLPDADTLDALAATGLPTLVRTGPGFPPAAAAETLLERGVPTILLSFGGYPLAREHMVAALDLLDDHESLWVETSHARFRDLLERGLREHPDRVVFGSGAPDVHPNASVMELLTLDVPKDAMRRAFTTNPARAVPSLDS